jgi:hypothetical protein
MQTYGRDRQSYGDVNLNAVIDAATPYCKDMMSVHVFAVKDDEGEQPAGKDGPSDGAALSTLRYYVVALLVDGRSILVWQINLTDDTYVNQPPSPLS